MARREIIATAPARVHGALLNCSGWGGRIDGGIGFAISSPCWKVRVRPAKRSRIGGAISSFLEAELAAPLKNIDARWAGIDAEVIDAVPAHMGFGSKTSLLMCLGRAAATFAAESPNAREVGLTVGRGGTSGIGVHVAFGGGFVWDAGHRFPGEKPHFGPSSSRLAPPPPLITRVTTCPGKLVHFRVDNSPGLSSAKEDAFFRSNCPTPPGEDIESLQAVALRLVPGLLENDWREIQYGLRTLQQLGFKAREWKAQTSATLAVREHWNMANRPEALCLSSLGPTLFCLTQNAVATVDFIKSLPLPVTDLTVASIPARGVACENGQPVRA